MTCGTDTMKVLLAAAPWSAMVNAYPPLGLAYLAAVLRERAGLPLDLRIMDFGLHPEMRVPEAARAVVENGPPHLLGLSCLTNNYGASLELAGRVKEACPGVKTVFGGPHPSVAPEKVATRAEVDAVVFGEGEETFLELVRRLAAGAWAEGLPGTAWGDEDAVEVNPSRPLMEDLDALPLPARDLLDLRRYGLRAEDGKPVYTVLTSRGCPYRCTYCFKGIFGHRYRARSPEKVLDELEELQRDYRARHIYFGDDLFMLHADRVAVLSEGMLRRGLDLAWSCLARVDTVTPELLAVMKRAGCVKIHYGIESGIPEVLERIRKKIDLDGVERAVRWTVEAGIRTKGYFMAGLPGDTEERLAETLRFARRLPLDEVMFSLATPFPGTALWDERTAQAGESAAQGAEPEVDYERAFYFDDGEGAVRAFSNCSEVETGRLEAFVRDAQAYFSRRRDRKAFTRRFGPLVGPLAHLAYRAMKGRGTVRRVGS